jgi:hypothetical protein
MYSTTGARGAKHAWMYETDGIGVISYTYVRIHQPLAPNLLSSVSCPSLGSESFAQIPSTHIIFSLASYHLTHTEVNVAEGKTYRLVTLCPAAAELWMNLQARSKDLLAAVKVLRKMKRNKSTTEVPLIGQPDAGESEESSSESGEE